MDFTNPACDQLKCCRIEGTFGFLDPGNVT